MKNKIFVLSLFLFASAFAHSQDINTLLQQVRSKLDLVKDYQATGTMKTNVTFLKVPLSKITMYYKKPDKLRIKSERGVSFIPRGAMNINMVDLFNQSSLIVLDAGSGIIDGREVKIAKLIPSNDNSELVLSTLYIDVQHKVILTCKTTTRENGSYELKMTYGKQISFGLPDKIAFTFNTRDYKLPKGITFDFDDGQTADNNSKQKGGKGSAEISISSYLINKGLKDDVFR